MLVRQDTAARNGPSFRLFCHYNEQFCVSQAELFSDALSRQKQSLTPVQIIELYARRFKIENCFREFKQQFGGFCYHFWTKKLPQINRFKKKGAPDPVDMVTDAKDKELILGKIRAIEGFVLIANIAMGITQMLSLSANAQNEVQKTRYLRSIVTTRISEATIMCYFRKNLFALLLQHPNSPITLFIQEKQEPLEVDAKSA